MFERGRGEGNGLEIESINGLVSSVICQHIIPQHTPPATINRVVVPVTKLKACGEGALSTAAVRL